MRFTRLELEEFRGCEVDDLVGPGLQAAVRRHQPGPVDGRGQDPLRPSHQPLLPGAGRGRHHRLRGRSGRRDDRCRSRASRRAGHRDHQPRAAGHRARLRALARGAARGRRAAAAVRRRAPARGRRDRRRHRLPRRVRRARRGFGPAAGHADSATRWSGAALWVVPNPSGLNAHETVATLAAAYAAPAAEAGIVAGAPA